MEGKSVKELKALAKEKGIKGYYRMRKAELIEVLEEESEIFYSANDQSVPEVDIPIPAPSRVTQMRNLGKGIAKPGYDLCFHLLHVLTSQIHSQ